MKHVMVRYTVRPEAAQENVRLIVRVFDRLRQSAPDGLSYASYRLDDGVTFVHVATVVDPDNSPLRELSEFHAFTSTIRDRCDIAPETTTLHEVGRYLHASVAAAVLT
ncbi:MAG: hypothetical protein H7Z40_13780 [Phycisphaerae bacterium]|nr:hypothetical protein [Gemmatimonadaceae bacterium]